MTRSAATAGAATVPDERAFAAMVEDLDRWRRATGATLVDLDDQLVGAAPTERDDLALTMVLWKSAGERIGEIALADARNVTARTAAMGRLDASINDNDGSALAATLAEARALVDAMIARLGATQESRAREETRWVQTTSAIRADLTAAGEMAEQLGDRVRTVAELSARLESLRAADRSSPIAAAEVDRSLTELAASASSLRAALDAARRDRDSVLARIPEIPGLIAAARDRQRTIEELAARCRDAIGEAPRLAVPSVDALGDPPATAPGAPWAQVRDGIGAFLDRLGRVNAAFDHLEGAFGDPLARRTELRGLLQAVRDKAAARGFAEDPAIEASYRSAHDVLWTAPTDLTRGQAAVDRYLAEVNARLAPSIAEGDAR